MKNLKVRFLFVSLLMSISSSHAVSVDCNNVKSNVEKAICQVNFLREADDKLNNLYEKFIQSLSEQEVLEAKSIDKDYLEQRNKCKNVTCLKNWYEERISYYEKLISEREVSPEDDFDFEGYDQNNSKQLAQDKKETDTKAANQLSAEPKDRNNSDNTKYTFIEAEGIGEDKISATKNAWQEAVRAAIGTYLTSKSTSIDDKFTEEIITHSRGQVESYSILEEGERTDGWHIKIRAKIEKDILEDTSRKIEKEQKIAFDESSKVAKKITIAQKKETEIQTKEHLIESVNFFECLNYNSVVGQTNNGKYYVDHYLWIDLDNYSKKANQLISQLNKTSTPQSVSFKDGGVSNRYLYNTKLDYGQISKTITAEDFTGIFYASEYKKLEAGNHHDYLTGSIGRNKIIIAKNFAEGVMYDFEHRYAYDGNKKKKIVFFAKTGDSFNDLNFKTPDYKYEISPCFMDQSNSYLIAPIIHQINLGFGSLVRYRQILNLTDDDLLRIKELRTGYEIIE